MQRKKGLKVHGGPAHDQGTLSAIPSKAWRILAQTLRELCGTWSLQPGRRVDGEYGTTKHDKRLGHGLWAGGALDKALGVS
ncbi:hypothetical protein AJ80_00547 [Polytolypa hystricis UAMH7299]|uniref:Uncharacterized protein n=1 Tax=Polytolypa hystricis (strain UAMH7299) TaxID=1447883 RepID=A0A2B7Z3D8_POLH7|nr:hypothetical protein AJ80_00547 [Polytolypa hystricis UAMH7299]